MKFAKMVDFGNTPEVSVDGLGGLELVTPHIIRCQYYTCHGESGATCEKRLVIALRWDTAQWLATWSRMLGMGPARLLDALPMLEAHTPVTTLPMVN